MEAGENDEQALRRELREEVGLDALEMGPLAWRREHIVEVERFEPHMSDAGEARSLDRFLWWRLAELVRPSEPVTPLALAHIITRYLDFGPPPSAPAWEVLIE